MPRKPEDQACDDLLVDQEAERLDFEAKQLAKARPRFEKTSKEVVALMVKRKPTTRDKKRAREVLLRAVLLEFARGGNAWQELVDRQHKERQKVFGGRSGEKLEIEPITKKRIAERQAAIAEARELAAQLGMRRG
jgi:hypothetical protein